MKQSARPEPGETGAAKLSSTSLRLADKAAGKPRLVQSFSAKAESSVFASTLGSFPVESSRTPAGPEWNLHLLV